MSVFLPAALIIVTMNKGYCSNTGTCNDLNITSLTHLFPQHSQTFLLVKQDMYSRCLVSQARMSVSFLSLPDSERFVIQGTYNGTLHMRDMSRVVTIIKSFI